MKIYLFKLLVQYSKVQFHELAKAGLEGVWKTMTIFSPRWSKSPGTFIQLYKAKSIEVGF